MRKIAISIKIGTKPDQIFEQVIVQVRLSGNVHSKYIDALNCH
jgi:hypothetical protein